jgi:hypothetical protein
MFVNTLKPVEDIDRLGAETLSPIPVFEVEEGNVLLFFWWLLDVGTYIGTMPTPSSESVGVFEWRARYKTLPRAKDAGSISQTLPPETPFDWERCLDTTSHIPPGEKRDVSIALVSCLICFTVSLLAESGVVAINTSFLASNDGVELALPVPLVSIEPIGWKATKKVPLR